MKNKSSNESPKRTLQKFEIMPITDPAVHAALDRLRRQAKPVVRAILRNYGDRKARKGN